MKHIIGKCVVTVSVTVCVVKYEFCLCLCVCVWARVGGDYVLTQPDFRKRVKLFSGTHREGQKVTEGGHTNTHTHGGFTS